MSTKIRTEKSGEKNRHHFKNTEGQTQNFVYTWKHDTHTYMIAYTSYTHQQQVLIGEEAFKKESARLTRKCVTALYKKKSKREKEYKG